MKKKYLQNATQIKYIFVYRILPQRRRILSFTVYDYKYFYVTIFAFTIT